MVGPAGAARSSGCGSVTQYPFGGWVEVASETVGRSVGVEARAGAAAAAAVAVAAGR